MNCPKADKLSQYADNLLTEQEQSQILYHLNNCDTCTSIVQLFKEEQEFLKVNLQSPTLPDHFASLVLDQLEPYKKKDIRRKKLIWKRIVLLAATITLAVVLTATLSPTFAQIISGMFSTKQVDEGLNMASDDGLGERINVEVSDQQLTLKVEDIIVDSSRVALSLQVINEKGIVEKPSIDHSIKGNRISVTGFNGEYNYTMGYRLDGGLDYNSFQVFISDEPGLEKVTINFHLVELNGKQGNWDLEIPVEISGNKENTKNVNLTKENQTINGVAINLKEIQFAPTSNTLLYETSYEASEQLEIEKNFKALKEQFGLDVSELTSFGTSIKYHIENEDNNVIMEFSPYIQAEPMDDKIIISSASGKEKIGHAVWKEVFVPDKNDSNLTFVLDGVYKVIPTDFSIKFNPKEIKENPVSFKYMGNEVTIKKAELQSSANTSDPTIFEIEMAVNQKSNETEFGKWLLKENTGRYFKLDSETTTGEVGDFKHTLYFKTNGLNDIPEEISLHLLTATNYFEIENKWRVPLYE
ncbi:DUF4179 domain-containing protein [Psychrobacillus psychrodurans]|uniref:DUF4179 domain-containing protein n=1 Tax=Psychrobacillus psychrodurans TaxID=126157 RepID=UPI0008E4E15A|nr:DUF4179 domain-containing protein [Psychrobacillus psychrodurans]MCZ8542528.1 DUF4179 domain-containing protein [Psychrobacillus psychrodurans]SFN28879.1 protein of unknown function [Psychrobacillus psychrodurans]